MNGHVALSRKILEWEWYNDANTMRVFVHCLLMANWKDKKWQGKTIARGSFITSIDHLSKDLKLSAQKIRTSLGKLEKTQEINKQTTNKYTLITVTNYEAYQTNQQTNNKQITNKQQQLNKGNKGKKDISTKSTNGAATPTPADLLQKQQNREIVDLIGRAFFEITGQQPVEAKWRHRAWNLVQRVDGKIKKHGKAPSHAARKKILARYATWLDNSKWARSMTKMEVMYEQFETYYAERVTNTRKGGGD